MCLNILELNRLFFKYYVDVTKYNLLFCLLFAVLRFNVIEVIILFGTVGIFVSFFVYRYFKNIEYYFYLNRGLSKKQLQLNTLVINLVASLLMLLIWSITCM
jgi:hypothetical protein